jgi:threonine dehydrogenase-like Zn-dependent dehydrogenase
MIPGPSITAPNEIKVKVLQVGICGTDRDEASAFCGSCLRDIKGGWHEK